jgi:hypothetical protein
MGSVTKPRRLSYYCEEQGAGLRARAYFENSATTIGGEVPCFLFAAYDQHRIADRRAGLAEIGTPLFGVNRRGKAGSAQQRWSARRFLSLCSGRDTDRVIIWPLPRREEAG